MQCWGRVPVWVGLGISLALGCGGRTSTLEGDYDYGESGSSYGAQGGTTSVGGTKSPTAGRPAKGGSTGRGGTTSVSGSGPAGGYGGSIIYPGGGYAGDYYPGGYGGYYPVSGAGGYYPVAGAGGYGGLDCQTCLKVACSPQLSQCFNDFGCLQIFTCMAANQCGSSNCYTDATCKGVIDEWGGPAGPPMSELLQTFVCAFNAGCQCG